MTRRSLTVLLAATLVLAGCTAGPGTPTNDRPGQSAADGTPPGVVDGRLANATALVHAHERSLAASGFAATLTRSTNGSRVGSFDVVASSGLATYELTWRRSGDADRASRTSVWANGSKQFVKVSAGGETSYRVVPRESDSLGVVESVGRYLAAGNFTVADERTAAGHTVLTADGYEPRSDGRGPFADVESFDGRAVVDDRGRVRELNVTVERPRGTETVTFELRRTAVESVSRPAWVGDVPPGVALAPELSVNVERDRYLVVRNEGGDAVPRNATLSLTSNGSAYRVTFDAPLEPGDVRYASVAADDGTLRLTGSRPDPADVAALSSPVSVSIETAGGASLHQVSMGWGSETASESGSGSSTSGEGGGAASGGSASGSGETSSESGESASESNTETAAASR